jgi:hypothetical protein
MGGSIDLGPTIRDMLTSLIAIEIEAMPISDLFMGRNTALHSP